MPGSAPVPRGGAGSRTPRLGRPPLVDHDAAVAAALAAGFGNLTVAAVADRLGVRPSTLYRLFPSRTALAAAAVERVAADQPWPAAPGRPARDWRRYLEDTTWTAWRLYDRHPGLAGEVASLAFAPPTLVAVTERSMAVLVGAGFAVRDALLVVDMAGELALSPFLGAQGGGASDPAGAEAGGGAVSVLDHAAARRRRLLDGLTDPAGTLNPAGTAGPDEPAGPDDTCEQDGTAGPGGARGSDGSGGFGRDPIAEAIAAVVRDDPRHWLQAKLDLFLDAAAARQEAPGNGAR